MATEYHHSWKKLSDPLHLDREDVVRSAVQVVQSQVRPRTYLPHEGSVNKTVVTILPLLEKVFHMPGAEAQVGTNRWIVEKLKTQDFRFEFLRDHEKLLAAYISHMIERGQASTGFPIVLPDEIIPFQQRYDVKNGKRKRKRRAKAPESWFPFLRSGAVHAAILELKNRNLYAPRVNPQERHARSERGLEQFQ